MVRLPPLPLLVALVFFLAVSLLHVAQAASVPAGYTVYNATNLSALVRSGPPSYAPPSL
jgi:hypothetical protein